MKGDGVPQEALDAMAAEILARHPHIKGIDMAPQDQLAQYEGAGRAFFDEILTQFEDEWTWDNVLVTDESRLWDFVYHFDPLEHAELAQLVYERFGVELAALPDDYLLTIFRAIDASDE